MEKGWDAAGRLEAVWGRVGGRDRLAQLTGIQPATLSGYNTGRLHLGIRNARLVAAATGVSILELGAPLEAVDEQGRGIADRLQELAEDTAGLQEWRLGIDRAVADIRRRLRRLESQPGDGGAAATHPRRAGGR